jgi:hypothetical protein
MSALRPGRTLFARKDTALKVTGDQGGEDVYELSYRVPAANSNAARWDDVESVASASVITGKKNFLKDNARIADMEWAFYIFLAVMLGLYVWSHVSAGHRIGKKLQPFVDELFGGSHVGEGERNTDPPAKPKAE